MNTALPESALDWRRRLRDFVDRELIPWEEQAEMSDGLLPPEVRARQRQGALALGLPGMDAPRAHGGLALPTLDQVMIHEQIGRVTNGLGWCFGEAQGWMFEACSKAQIDEYVRGILQGRRHECYAITEAGPGSDVASLAATARREGDDYLLSGEKWYVTSFNLADFCFFQAVLADGARQGEHALFLVDLDRPGIEVVRTPRFSHTFEAHHPIVRFTDVRVPAAKLVGAEGEGMAFAHAWFRRERLMIAARCCGAAERLIEAATDFAKGRALGNQSLADQQLVQAMLADCATELWAARAMTRELARDHDRGEDVKRLHARCSMAKLFASEMANRVADRAVQIFGGRGYMRENVAERFFRELRVDRIWEGTSEIQRLIVARSLVKRGLDGL